MRRVVLVVLFLLALLLVPRSSAVGAACTREETATAAGLYLQDAGIRTKVWEESNGVVGLQTGSCASNGTPVVADTLRFAGVPPDFEILGFCVIVVIFQCF